MRRLLLLLPISGCLAPDLPVALRPSQASLAERCGEAIRRQAAPAPVTILPSAGISDVQVELMVSIDYPEGNRTARVVCTQAASGLTLSEAKR